MTKFRVVKEGYDITTTDLRGVLLDSDYGMFKYHLDQTDTLTVNAGDTTASTSFAHGLGYVPAFIAYLKIGESISPLPRRDIAISGVDRSWFAYADDTNIYIKWISAIPYNQQIIYASDYYNSYYNNNTAIYVGNFSGNLDGAMRFTGIDLNKSESFISATIDFRVYVKGSGTGNLEMEIFGIKEDNTADFTTDPLGRSSTNASHTQSQSLPTPPFFFGVNVKNELSEITSRSGWSNGNAAGFLFRDHGSPSNVYVGDGVGSDVSILKIQKSGSISYSFRVIVFKDKISD
jgi:hypothetical protein